METQEVNLKASGKFSSSVSYLFWVTDSFENMHETNSSYRNAYTALCNFLVSEVTCGLFIEHLPG